jgi:phytoene dehydrogenase-like protein
VPAGSTEDRTEAIIRRIEEFAPGFRDLIIGTATLNAVQMEQHDPKYIGGDISAGAPDFGQLIARPVLSTDPWRMPGRGLYLASASVVPGPGVHGLGGYYAARSALRHEFGISRMPDLSPGPGQSFRSAAPPIVPDSLRPSDYPEQ